MRSATQPITSDSNFMPLGQMSGCNGFATLKLASGLVHEVFMDAFMDGCIGALTRVA